jgi:hypothetical protein
MKYFLTALLFFAAGSVSAQRICYAAARTGIPLREAPNTSAATLLKIPYGEKLSLGSGDYQGELNVEGFSGSWTKLTYGGKTGYISDIFLLPAPPPKPKVNTFKGYLAQISSPFGAPFKVANGNKDNEDYTENLKQLYKNGGEWHSFSAYESGSETVFLPGFSIQQCYLLLRLLKCVEAVGENDPFPRQNGTVKGKDADKTIELEPYSPGDLTGFLRRMRIGYAPGASYELEIFTLDNQAVIYWGGGL